MASASVTTIVAVNAKFLRSVRRANPRSWSSVWPIGRPPAGNNLGAQRMVLSNVSVGDPMRDEPIWLRLLCGASLRSGGAAAITAERTTLLQRPCEHVLGRIPADLADRVEHGGRELRYCLRRHAQLRERGIEPR